MRRMTVLLVAAAAALGAACGNNSALTGTTTSPTPAATTTDTFNGTLNQNGGVTHTFLTARSGNITATLASLGPDAGITVGLAIGTWNGNACQLVITKDNAVQTSSIIGQATSAGNLCVRIFDVGNVTDPVAYQIDVLHP